MATTSTHRTLLALCSSLTLLCQTSLAEPVTVAPVQEVTASNAAADAALIKACRSGDAEAAKAALANKANPNAAIPNSSPLGTALLFGHEAVALLLIEAGAKPDTPNKVGQTPLMLACFRSSEPLVKALIAAKCELDAIDKSRNSALMYACSHFKTKPQLVTALLDAGSNPLPAESDDYLYSQRSALDLALNQKDDSLFELLLSKVNREDPNFSKALDSTLAKACRAGNLVIVKKLDNLGANLQQYGEDYYNTPLGDALAGKHTELVQYLLAQHTLDLNDKKQVQRLLNLSYMEFNAETLSLLLDYGLDANSGDGDGKPLLHQAIAAKDVALIKLLIERGADPKLKDDEGRDALFMAQTYMGDKAEIIKLLNPEGQDISMSAEKATQALDLLLNSESDVLILNFRNSDRTKKSEHHNRIKELIELGASPNGAPSSEQCFPLAYAYQNKDWDLFDWLLEQGADINKQSKYRGSVLECALNDCTHADFSEVERLIQSGADIKQQGRYRDFIYEDLLRGVNEKEAKKALAFLRAQGVDLNAQTAQGRTLLFTCSAKAITLLVAEGLDLNHRDHEGNAPLSYRILYSYNMDEIDALLAMGAKTDGVNNQGRNILMMAVRNDDMKKRLDKLLALGFDLETQDEDGNTAYLIACADQNLVAIKKLVAAGANTKHANKEGMDGLLCLLDDCYSNEASWDCYSYLMQQGHDIKKFKTLDGSTALHIACSGMQKRIACDLIERGADVNAKTKDGETALYFLSWRTAVKVTDIMKALLAAGGDPNLADEDGNTALMQICGNSDKYACERAEILLKAGAQVNAANESGTTALMRAMSKGNQKLVDLLLSHGADNRAVNKANKTMLMHAVLSDNIELVKYCMGLGDSVTGCTTDGKTPLIFACERAQDKVVAFLLEQGADPHAADLEGQSSLMDACAYWNSDNSGALNCVDMLLAAGVKVDAQTKAGKTALHFAAGNPKPQNYMARLLKAGADINHKDKEGMSAILILADEGRVGLPYLEELSRQGAHLDDTNKKGQGLIHHSIKNYDSDLLKQLLLAGWDADVKDKEGKTPLYYACKAGSMEHIHLLIAAGADLQALSNGGETMMHAAAQAYEAKVCALMQSKGLALDALDAEGRSPLFYACREGRDEVVRTLIAEGADVKLLNHKGQSMLHAVCMSDNAELLPFLLEQALDVNAVDAEGNTPYLLACQYGERDMLELLLKAGAKMGTINKAGKTELMASCQNNYFDLVELVLAQGGDINAVDAEGKTALIYACSEGKEAHACTFTAGNFKVVQALHAKGADWTIKDKSGKTAADYAKIQNNPSILKFISELTVSH